MSCSFLYCLYVFFIVFFFFFFSLFFFFFFFFFSSRRRHTRFDCDWSFRRVLFRSSARQPATTSVLHAPVFLNSAISRMASTDSCLALSMKAQVLTTSTSAPSGSRVSSCPACWANPSITSESTRFFGQPSDTMPIFIPLQRTTPAVFLRPRRNGRVSCCEQSERSFRPSMGFKPGRDVMLMVLAVILLVAWLL